MNSYSNCFMLTLEKGKRHRSQVVVDNISPFITGVSPSLCLIPSPVSPFHPTCQTTLEATKQLTLHLPVLRAGTAFSFQEMLSRNSPPTKHQTLVKHRCFLITSCLDIIVTVVYNIMVWGERDRVKMVADHEAVNRH